MKTYRFPGVSSFEDNEISGQLFFGRDEDENKLFHFILSESLTVLFSKSGYGKTSLLQAKVFNKLRQKSYFPLLIRLNQKNLSPLDVIKLKLNEIENSESHEIIYSEIEELKDFLENIEIWSKEDKLYTPVLVFDQFEEIFTLDHNLRYREKFFSELSRIVHSTAEKGVGIKIVISIREDFLGHLEKLSIKIPFIFTNRFRLESLKKATAKAAIIKPSIKEIKNVEFESPQFTFSSEALESLLHFLSLKMADGKLIETDEVEPIQLQIICRELEERIVRGQILPIDGVITIRKNDLGGKVGMRDMLGNFYQKQLDNLQDHLRIPSIQLQAVRNVIEAELISGKRRVPLDYHVITNKENVPKEAIDFLIKNKLLKIVNHQSNSLVELSHDTLVEPIIKSYEKRRNAEIIHKKHEELEIHKNKLRKTRIYLSVVSVLLFICFLLGFLLLNSIIENNRKSEEIVKKEDDIKSKESDNNIKSASILTLEYTLKQQEIAQEAKILELDLMEKQLKQKELTADSLLTTAKMLKIRAEQMKYLSAANIYLNSNPTFAQQIAYLGANIDTSFMELRLFHSLNDRGYYPYIISRKKIDSPPQYVTVDSNSIVVADIRNITEWNIKGGINKKFRSGKRLLFTKTYGRDTYSIAYDDEENRLMLINFDGKILRYFDYSSIEDGDFYISNKLKYFRIGSDLYDLEHEKPIASIPEQYHQGLLSCIFSSDDQYIIEGHWSGSIFIYNIKGELIKELHHNIDQPKCGANSLAVTTDMKYLVSGGRQDNTIGIWEMGSINNPIDTIETKLVARIKNDHDLIKSIAISPDNEYILAPDKDIAYMWNFKGEKEAVLSGQKSEITYVNFSTDGNEIITASKDGFLYVWSRAGKLINISNDREIVTFSPYEYSQIGINSKVNSNLDLNNLIDFAFTYTWSLPQENRNIRDVLFGERLNHSVNELLDLYNTIFNHPLFYYLPSKETIKELYIDYASILFRKEVEYNKNDNISERMIEGYGMRDIWMAKSLLLDTAEVAVTDAIFYANDLKNVAKLLFESKHFNKSLFYLKASDDLLDAFHHKLNNDEKLTNVIRSIKYDLCINLFYNFKYDDAERVAKQEVTLANGKGYVNTLLIRSYLLNNKYEQAIEHYNKIKDHQIEEEEGETFKIALLRQINVMESNGITHKNFKRFIDYLNI